MTSTASRGPYAKTAGVRLRILEACEEAFGETGFYASTMKDIAKRADISHTGLLHHFARKEELLVAVLELRDERSVSFLQSTGALDTTSDPIEVLRAMLKIFIENELRPGIVELHCVLSGEATAADHPAHTYYANRSQALRDFYARTYTALAERGLLRSAIDVQTLATITISLVNGIQTQWLYHRDSVDIEHTLRQFLLTLLQVPVL